MNLFDYSESINKNMQQLKEGVSKIRIDDENGLLVQLKTISPCTIKNQR